MRSRKWSKKRAGALANLAAFYRWPRTQSKRILDLAGKRRLPTISDGTGVAEHRGTDTLRGESKGIGPTRCGVGGSNPERCRAWRISPSSRSQQSSSSSSI